MVKVVGTIGTGITEQAILRMDVAEGDLSAIVRAANHTMAMEYFSTASRVIANTAKNVLEEFNLPSDPRGVYALRGGEWGQIEGQISPPGDYDSFFAVFMRLGIPTDSQVVFAARALVLIEQIRSSPDRPDESLARAIKLGEIVQEAKFKAAWEQDALRGAAIHRAAKAGDEAAHGTKEHREFANSRIRQMVQDHVASGMTRAAAYRAVSAATGLHPKTVERKFLKKNRDESRPRP